MKQTTPWPVLVDDAAFGHAEEADVEVVQPLSFRPAHPPGRPVGLRKLALLVHRHAGEAVVRRIAQDHQNRLFLLSPVRRGRALPPARETAAASAP